MAQITKSIAAGHRLVANLVPSEVLKSIDQAELLDRVIYAEDLSRKSRTAADPTLRRGYAAVAKAVLSAQPRAVTERESAALIAKAAGAPNTSQADALRRKAQELLEQHPPAPRRKDSAQVVKAQRIAKAAADDDETFMICYDANGQPVGVCSPDAVTPVSSDLADEVIKAAQDGRTLRLHRRGRR